MNMAMTKNLLSSYSRQELGGHEAAMADTDTSIEVGVNFATFGDNIFTLD